MSKFKATPLHHEVVRASAGAGKTYQLTSRYLGLLGRGEPAPHILATTFTRKAAGEVLARVLGRLSEACSDERKRELLGAAIGRTSLTRSESVVMLRGLVESLNRLSVGTIDGFFNRAARALSLELGLPVDPRMIDEGSPLAVQMRSDAIHALLGEQAARDGGMLTLIEMLRRLHHDETRRSVAEAIDDIVLKLGETYSSYPGRELWDRLPDTGLLDSDLLTTLRHDLEAMADQLPTTKKTGELNSSWADRYNELIDAVHAGRWEDLLDNGLMLKVMNKQPQYSRAAIPDSWNAVLYPLGLHAKAVRTKALAEQTLATYDLLRLFDEQYKQLRLRNRVMLFSDLTNLLADGLPGMGGAGVEELCFRLDTRVTHLLLDEFQDTSLRQWQVLAPFALEITSTEEGRSFYCVGDTKQAIYGWRGGCAELFDEVEQLPGVERKSLSRSWRSSPVVLDAVNRVFGTLAGNAALSGCERAAGDWQAGFETHAAQKTELSGHVVLRTTAAPSAGPDSSIDDQEMDDATSEQAPPDAHAQDVAGYILQLTRDYPTQTVGVLVRSRKSARTLMHALRTLGVHAAEEGGNPIDSNPAVSAVLSAVWLADHPGDTVAYFHVTNSPIGEVLGMTAGADRQDPEVIARRLRRELLDRGYAAVIADWTLKLAPQCDARSLGRLMQLIELAERYDQEDAGLRPGFFVEAARAEKVEDASPAMVRVMTIHAAKGLEFDHVVLPELDAALTSKDSGELLVLDRDSPIAPVRGIYRRPKKELMELLPELKHATDQQAYEKRTGDLCLLYVAMTRAKQGLHMLVKPLKQKNKNGIAQGEPTSVGLTNLSYAAILRQALCESPGKGKGFSGGEVIYESGSAFGSHRAEVSENDGASDPELGSVIAPIRLAKPVAGQGRSWAQTSPSAMHNDATVTADDLLRLSPGGGRAFGTLVHGMLERVGFVDEEPVDESSLKSAVPSALIGSIEAGQALGLIGNMIAQPKVHALLSREGADELWRERPFSVRLENRLVCGTFDRVHLWRRGGAYERALLIDYKTDRVDDSSLDAKVAAYAGQLAAYRAALALMLRLDSGKIDTVLCFVGDARVVSVTT